VLLSPDAEGCAGKLIADFCPGLNLRVRPGFFYVRVIMGKRLGFVGIIIENREKSSSPVNRILSQYGGIIVSRTGMPYEKKRCCVITLIVDATTDEMGALTGKLGSVEGVTVKSALGKKI